jgi:hypothetical protein
MASPVLRLTPYLGQLQVKVGVLSETPGLILRAKCSHSLQPVTNPLLQKCLATSKAQFFLRNFNFFDISNFYNFPRSKKSVFSAFLKLSELQNDDF